MLAHQVLLPPPNAQGAKEEREEGFAFLFVFLMFDYCFFFCLRHTLIHSYFSFPFSFSFFLQPPGMTHIIIVIFRFPSASSCGVCLLNEPARPCRRY